MGVSKVGVIGDMVRSLISWRTMGYQGRLFQQTHQRPLPHDWPLKQSPAADSITVPESGFNRHYSNTYVPFSFHEPRVAVGCGLLT